MTRNEIERDLKEILSVVLEHNAAPTVSRANEAAWDSLKHMQIVFAIEEKFNVQFSEAEIVKLDSFELFAKYLQRHYET